MYDSPELYEPSYHGVYPNEVPFFHAALSRAGLRPGARVLELAAGSGRVTLPLARRGWAMTALDSSPPMLEALRRKASAEGLEVACLDADLEAVPTPTIPFDGIVAPLGVVAQAWTIQRARRCFDSMARALRPGGTAVLVLPAARNPTAICPHSAMWDAAEDGVSCRSYFEYDQATGEPPGVVAFTYRILARRQGMVEPVLLSDRGLLRLFDEPFLSAILDGVPELGHPRWFPMFDDSAPLAGPPESDGAAVLILARHSPAGAIR